MADITRIFKDIDMSLQKNPITGDIYTKTGEASIKQSVKNLILLNYYEKPYHPDIGGGIYKMLFENFDSPGIETVLKDKIESIIRRYEPRIDLINIKIENKYDQNSVAITLNYKIINTLKPDNITIFLQVVR